MLTFILWVLLVLQKKESSDLDSGGTLPGLCPLFNTNEIHTQFHCFNLINVTFPARMRYMLSGQNLETKKAKKRKA